MGYKIDIAADIGESFGLYRFGNDENIVKYLKSANVACGFHAGDPHVMRATVKLCKKYGVAVGGHPGLPDMEGFGRRYMVCKPQEITNYLVYQVGALKEFLRIENMKIQHTLPHGELGTQMLYDKAYAEGVVEFMKEMGLQMVLSGGLDGPTARGRVVYELGKKAGIRMGSVFILDMDYDSNGDLVMTRTHGPVNVKDRVERALKMIKKGKISSIDGKELDYRATTLLGHSDTPNLDELMTHLYSELKREGVEALPLGEIV